MEEVELSYRVLQFLRASCEENRSLFRAFESTEEIDQDMPEPGIGDELEQLITTDQQIDKPEAPSEDFFEPWINGLPVSSYQQSDSEEGDLSFLIFHQPEIVEDYGTTKRPEYAFREITVKQGARENQLELVVKRDEEPLHFYLTPHGSRPLNSHLDQFMKVITPYDRSYWSDLAAKYKSTRKLLRKSSRYKNSLSPNLSRQESLAVQLAHSFRTYDMMMRFFSAASHTAETAGVAEDNGLGRSPSMIKTDLGSISSALAYARNSTLIRTVDYLREYTDKGRRTGTVLGGVSSTIFGGVQIDFLYGLREDTSGLIDRDDIERRIMLRTFIVADVRDYDSWLAGYRKKEGSPTTHLHEKFPTNTLHTTFPKGPPREDMWYLVCSDIDLSDATDMGLEPANLIVPKRVQISGDSSPFNLYFMDGFTTNADQVPEFTNTHN